MSMMVNPSRFSSGGIPDDFSSTPNIKIEFKNLEEESANFTTEIFNQPVRQTAAPQAGAGSYKGDASNTSAVKLSSNLDLGAGDFSLKFKVKASAEPVTSYLAGRWGTSGNRSWRCTYNAANNQFIIELSTDGAATAATVFYDFDTHGAMSVATFFNGTWREVEFKRVSGTVSVVVEGVTGGTAAYAGTPYTGGTNSTYIGASGATSANPSTNWQEEMDEVLFTVGGTTKVDFSFDDYFASVLGGSTSGGPVVCANSTGSPRYDQYGVIPITSIRCPYVANVTDFDLGSGDFTVEVFKVRTVGAAFSSHTSGAGIFGCWSTTAGQLCWQFYIDGSGNFAFRYSTNGTSAAASISMGTIGSADTDYDLAAVRSGSNLYLYINGVRVVSTTISGTIYNPGTSGIPLGILSGQTTSGNSGAMANTARMRGCRITKGIARFQNASYTVPTLPLP